MFNLQPTLIGTMVYLKPLTENDYDGLFKVASDPLIWEQHPNNDRYKPEVFKDFFTTALASGGAFVVIEQNTKQIIGSSRYFGYSESESEVEIGWSFLARSHWGGKVNSEMKQLMISHAFQYVENIVFRIGPQNLRSRKAVEKIGAQFIGTRTSDGVENVVYRLQKNKR